MSMYRASESIKAHAAYPFPMDPFRSLTVTTTYTYFLANRFNPFTVTYSTLLAYYYRYSLSMS